MTSELGFVFCTCVQICTRLQIHYWQPSHVQIHICTYSTMHWTGNMQETICVGQVLLHFDNRQAPPKLRCLADPLMKRQNIFFAQTFKLFLAQVSSKPFWSDEYCIAEWIITKFTKYKYYWPITKFSFCQNFAKIFGSIYSILHEITSAHLHIFYPDPPPWKHPFPAAVWWTNVSFDFSRLYHDARYQPTVHWACPIRKKKLFSFFTLIRGKGSKNRQRKESSFGWVRVCWKWMCEKKKGMRFWLAPLEVGFELHGS